MSPRQRRRQLPAGLLAIVQTLEPRKMFSGAPSEFVDPHPQAGNQFGAEVTVLMNGNVVITSPNDNAGSSGAGAVYLFDGRSGSLISTLTGSNPGDHVGSDGVTALKNGNFVIDSSDWNGQTGAVTFGNGNTGVSGIVNKDNSLTGNTIGDRVGDEGVTALSTGNYVVDSSFWNNSDIVSAGAVTFCDGKTGTVGVINSTNSLLGTHNNDSVGDLGVTALTNGNYVVDSYFWDNALGAVTFGNGIEGATGVVSAVNSLIGQDGYDQIGSGGVTALPNGNYVIDSSHPYTQPTIGAVTFGSGTDGISGVVSAANSLVGDYGSDNEVGDGGITILSNGNYVISSPGWEGNKGAVTFGSKTIGVAGVLSENNSLIGSTAGDELGYDGIQNGVVALQNGNYVVASYYWNGGYSTGMGAVTFCNGITGTIGTVDATNSLVGTSSGDHLGVGGVTPLSNGNYVVDSYDWNNGLGAVTFGNGTKGVIGSVSAANSLVGNNSGDKVGYNNSGQQGVTALTNGNYVVSSTVWNHDGGAATFGNGTTGLTGIISASNSLLGTDDVDWIGAHVTALSNGNYVVGSDAWDNFAGAATFGNGTTGISGYVNGSNSLVGSVQDDHVGSSITALSNGNYVVDTPGWSQPITIVSNINSVGAVTFGNGETGVTGTVGLDNSLVGSHDYDAVGDGGLTTLSNGNYVVSSFDFGGGGSGGGLGAVTFGSGINGISGVLTTENSVVGQTVITPPVDINNTPLPSIFIFPDNAHNAVYASFPYDGAGHVYRGSATAGFLEIGPQIAVANGTNALTNGKSTVNFGNATVGIPVSQTFTVTNTGDTALIVQPVTAPVGFRVLGNFTSDESIPAGSSASFTIQMTAASVGTPSGSVTINDNDPTASPFTFNISGTVNAAPVPHILVTNGTNSLTNGVGIVDFGNSTVGTPVLETITVTNTGNAALVLQPVSIAGTGYTIASNFTANQSISPGSSANFTIQLIATAVGTTGGIVTISDSDITANPFTFKVSSTAAVFVNQPPMGTQNTVTIIKGVPYTVQTSDFGFSDPNNNPANNFKAVKITLLSAYGTLTDDGVLVTPGQFVSAAHISGRKLVFTPTSNSIGGPLFLCLFQVQDDGGTANGGIDLDPNPKRLLFNVLVPNHAPVGTPTTVTTLKDTPYTIKTTDFGLTDPNDSPANNLKAVKIDLLSSYGTLTDNGVPVTVGQFVSAADIASGKLIFTPTLHIQDAVPLFLCLFQVDDDGGTANGGTDLDPNPTRLLINVLFVNHAPVGTPKTVFSTQDTPYTLKTSDFGFSDPNDNPANNLKAVKFTLLSSYGTLTDNGVPVTAGQFVSASDISSGQLVFTPQPNLNYFSPLFLCLFQVQDDGGTANGGTDLDPNPERMLINFTVPNHAPVGIPSTVKSAIDTPYTLTTSDFGFSDPKDTPANNLKAVKFTLLSSYGTLTDNGVPVTVGQFVSATDISSGQLVFTPQPNLNYYGALFLCLFQVQDDGGTAKGGVDLDPNPVRMLINYTAPNHAPVGTPATVYSPDNTPYTLKTSDFGFSDPGDNPANNLKAVKFIGPSSYGTLTDNGVPVAAGQFVSATDINNGLLVFTPQPNLNYYAPLYLTQFQVQDEGGTVGGGVDLDPNPKRLLINFTFQNHAPIGTSSTVGAIDNTPLTIKSAFFGLNDPNDLPANNLKAVKFTILSAYGTLADNGVPVVAGQFVSAKDIDSGKLVFTPQPNLSSYGSLLLCQFQVQDDGGTMNGGADLDPNPKTLLVNFIKKP